MHRIERHNHGCLGQPCPLPCTYLTHPSPPRSAPPCPSAVEALLGQLDPAAPPLEVSAPGGRACSLHSYAYGALRMYRLQAAAYLASVGAKAGEPFAVFR